MSFTNYSINTTFNNNVPIDVNFIKKMLKNTESVKEFTQKEFANNDADNPPKINTSEGILTQMDSDDEMNRKQAAVETDNSTNKLSSADTAKLLKRLPAPLAFLLPILGLQQQTTILS
jgi:hypothetical protein